MRAELRLPPVALDESSVRRIAGMVAELLKKDLRKDSDAAGDVERMISPKEAAERLGVHRVTLDKMERRGDLPRRRAISEGSRTVGWLSSEFEAWLKKRPLAVGGQPPSVKKKR